MNVSNFLRKSLGTLALVFGLTSSAVAAAPTQIDGKRILDHSITGTQIDTSSAFTISTLTVTGTLNANITNLSSMTVTSATINTLSVGTITAQGLVVGGVGTSIPAGTIVMVGTSTVPPGWLECNGDQVEASSSTVPGNSWAGYPQLWAAIGCNFGCEINGVPPRQKFRVPDLRGRFPRGWDHQGYSWAGRDPDAATRGSSNLGAPSGDVVGSTQTDRTGPHTHSIPGSGEKNQAAGTYDIPANSTSRENVAVDATAESRPKNINVMFLIRAETGDATAIGGGGGGAAVAIVVDAPLLGDGFSNNHLRIDDVFVKNGGDTMTGDLYLGTNSVTATNLRVSGEVTFSSATTNTSLVSRGAGRWTNGMIDSTGGLGTGGLGVGNNLSSVPPTQRISEGGDISANSIRGGNTRLRGFAGFNRDETHSITAGWSSGVPTFVDINGDGVLDLVGSLNEGRFQIQYGLGGGLYGSAPVSSYVCPSGANAYNGGGIALGDVNGDGLTDILVPCGHDSAVAVLLSTGARAGAWTGLSPQYSTILSTPSGNSFQLADFNRDGKLDLIYRRATAGNLNIYVQLGNGDGAFGPIVWNTASSYLYSMTPTIGDYNGDGILDLFDPQETTFRMYFGVGDGTFGSPVTTSVGDGCGITGSGAVTADFNRDNKLDMALAVSGCSSPSSRIQIRLNNGSATTMFSSANQTYGASMDMGYLYTGDIDGDGYPDLATHGTSYQDWYLLNSSTGGFPAGIQVIGTSNFTTPGAGALADVDGDGLLDFIVSRALGWVVWFNAGNEAPMLFAQSSTRRIGLSTGTPQNTLDVRGDASFGTGVGRSTFTTAGDLTLGTNSDLTLTGPSAYFTSGSSVTASGFFGPLVGNVTSNTGSIVALSASSASITSGRFDVGGSTFSIAGGTVTVAYRVNAGSFSGDGTNLSSLTNVVIRTKAEFDLMTPTPGTVSICSDCAVPYDLCVATGSTLSGFRAVMASLTTGAYIPAGCGSGN